MKICYVIAEYNPLHNGHLKHINFIKQTLSADKVIVIMSGNFVQRGEPAVLNKFKRATHAIQCGADLVIELPTPFATANAETFALGAVKVINSLNLQGTLCFGVENGNKEQYLSLAKILVSESKEFKKALKENLEQGVSLAKAKSDAVKKVYQLEFAEQLTCRPNNILALEYVKALLKTKSNVDFYPMLRTGDHNDKKLYKNITSATSIREVLKTGKLRKLKKVMPNFTYKSLNGYPEKYDSLALLSLIREGVNGIKLCPDCTEGLENRISAFASKCESLQELIKETITKRYTETRVKRIILSNFLKITQDFLQESLKCKLYAKVLAISESSLSLLSEITNASSIPLLTRKTDESKLSDSAKKVFDKDLLASELYGFITGEKQNPYQMIIVK